MLLRTALALPLLLLGQAAPPVPAAATVQAAPAPLEDGPYVIWQGDRATVHRIRAGKVEAEPLPASRDLSLAGLHALPGLRSLALKPAAPGPALLPPCPRIAAVSDIHGNLQGLLTLLQAHGVIGGDQGWRFGKGRLVVVGDIFDRGFRVTEIVWFLRALAVQAAAAGGGVHVLLGNHEAMVAAGDLRYLHAKYATLPPEWLAGPDSEQGRWLRTLPAFLRIGDVLFTHGGPSPSLAAGGLDLEGLNARIRTLLGPVERRDPLLRGEGPLWYRGLLPGASGKGEASPEQVTAILAAAGAKALVVGHTTLRRITAYHEGRVFGIDAGLQDGLPGELWLQEDGRRYRGLADGARVALD